MQHERAVHADRVRRSEREAGYRQRRMLLDGGTVPFGSTVQPNTIITIDPCAFMPRLPGGTR